MQILFLYFSSFGVFFHIFTVANQLPGFSVSRLANVEDFLNPNIVNIFVNCKFTINCKYKCQYEKL